MRKDGFSPVDGMEIELVALNRILPPFLTSTICFTDDTLLWPVDARDDPLLNPDCRLTTFFELTFYKSEMSNRCATQHF